MSKLSTKPEERLLQRLRPTIGCDPELFIASKNGEVVGAEHLIPTDGLKTAFNTSAGVVLDGVQLELHPAPSSCRQSTASSIVQIMAAFKAKLDESKEYKASFQPVVTIRKKELDSLSDQAKVLGCAPSLNTHKPNATVRVAKKHQRMRSAGGHIHLGVDNNNAKTQLGLDSNGKPNARTKQLVDLFDVLVGLPCVLLDRDPNQRLRRRIYGRAGEFRLPPHGIEYRVPSNFWLRSKFLFYFVTGQMRLAYSLWYYSFTNQYDPMNRMQIANKFDFYADLMRRVDMKKVEKAINRNDYDLAMEQWVNVADFIEEHVPQISSGLWSGTKDQFIWFAEEIRKNGLEGWFPYDPLDAWISNKGVPQGAFGFESWFQVDVMDKYSKRAGDPRLPEVYKTAVA